MWSLSIKTTVLIEDQTNFSFIKMNLWYDQKVKAEMKLQGFN